MPTSPTTMPNSLRRVNGSWRVISHVPRKAMTGDAELRMVANPASTERSAHAMSVNGTALFKHACRKKRRHIAKSRGIAIRRAFIQNRRVDPAIRVRAAISVSGGMVVTPIRMNV